MRPHVLRKEPMSWCKSYRLVDTLPVGLAAARLTHCRPLTISILEALRCTDRPVSVFLRSVPQSLKPSSRPPGDCVSLTYRFLSLLVSQLMLLPIFLWDLLVLPLTADYKSCNFKFLIYSPLKRQHDVFRYQRRRLSSHGKQQVCTNRSNTVLMLIAK